MTELLSMEFVLLFVGGCQSRRQFAGRRHPAGWTEITDKRYLQFIEPVKLQYSGAEQFTHAWLALKVKAKALGKTLYQTRNALFSDYRWIELVSPQINAFMLV
jgi:hypothetical protein